MTSIGRQAQLVVAEAEAILKKGFTRVDDRRRIAVGKYTELQPGDYFRIAQNEDGTLTLTPVPYSTEVGA